MLGRSIVYMYILRRALIISEKSPNPSSLDFAPELLGLARLLSSVVRGTTIFIGYYARMLDRLATCPPLFGTHLVPQ